MWLKCVGMPGGLRKIIINHEIKYSIFEWKKFADEKQNITEIIKNRLKIGDVIENNTRFRLYFLDDNAFISPHIWYN